MNDGIGLSDDLACRRDRAVTAALRAAFAWSCRNEHLDAMYEVAKMTGVVMEACGPAAGPATPMDLIARLHEPLGGLLDFDPGADETISAVRLLEGDGLSSAAQDIACEYVLPLDTEAGKGEWMPRWARMRASRAGVSGTRKGSEPGAVCRGATVSHRERWRHQRGDRKCVLRPHLPGTGT